MRTVLFAALLLAAALPAAGCGEDKPLIEVSPATHDFGRVLKGQLPEFGFTLTNNSTRVVAFKAQPNCSCFAVAQGLAPLDPGQSRRFQVLFDTTALPAQRVKGKWIRIHTDHPDMEEIVVPLEGEIYRVYEIRPSSFNLGRIDGRPENHKARVVQVRTLEGHEVELTGSFAMPPIFDIVAVPQEGGGINVEVTLRESARRAIGVFRAQIRLELRLTAPDGKVSEDKPILKLQGLWSKE
jgi:hypothetical protein